MSASRGDRESDLVLTGKDLDRAIAILTETEKKMQNVFSGVGKSDISDLIERMMTFLLTSKTTEVPIFQIASYFRSDMDKLTMDRVFATLESMNFCKVCHRPGADDYVKVVGKMEGGIP